MSRRNSEPTVHPNWSVIWWSKFPLAAYFAALSTLGPASTSKSVGVPTAWRPGSAALVLTAAPPKLRLERPHSRFTSAFAPNVEAGEFPLVMTKLRPPVKYQPSGGGASSARPVAAAVPRSPTRATMRAWRVIGSRGGRNAWVPIERRGPLCGDQVSGLRVDDLLAPRMPVAASSPAWIMCGWSRPPTMTRVGAFTWGSRSSWVGGEGGFILPITRRSASTL